MPGLHQHQQQSRGGHVQPLPYHQQQQPMFVQGGARPKQWPGNTPKSHLPEDNANNPTVVRDYTAKDVRDSKQHQQQGMQIDAESRSKGQDHAGGTSTGIKTPRKRNRRKGQKKK